MGLSYGLAPCPVPLPYPSAPRSDAMQQLSMPIAEEFMTFQGLLNYLFRRHVPYLYVLVPRPRFNAPTTSTTTLVRRAHRPSGGQGIGCQTALPFDMHHICAVLYRDQFPTHRL